MLKTKWRRAKEESVKIVGYKPGSMFTPLMCKACGTKVDHEDRFCRSCGVQLRRLRETMPCVPSYCTQCGKKLHHEE